jgi:hypothetical protein
LNFGREAGLHHNEISSDIVDLIGVFNEDWARDLTRTARGTGPDHILGDVFIDNVGDFLGFTGKDCTFVSVEVLL